MKSMLRLSFTIALLLALAETMGATHPKQVGAHPTANPYFDLAIASGGISRVEPADRHAIHPSQFPGELNVPSDLNGSPTIVEERLPPP